LLSLGDTQLQPTEIAGWRHTTLHRGGSMRAKTMVAVMSVLTMGMAQTSSGTIHDVDIRGFAFDSDDLTIRAGDTVRWTNSDFAPHTATADDRSWDTGILDTGESASITFDEADIHPYHCDVHPSMKATLTVDDAACDLVVSLTGQPGSIARGETLRFTATASNDCDERKSLDEAVMVVTGPAGITQTLYDGADLSVQPGGSLGAPVALGVPGFAPVGRYEVTITIYLDGGEISSDSFEIDVD
jgi:plastocyanin